MGREACSLSRRTRCSSRCPPREVRHSLGYARRAFLRLRNARLAPARRVSSGKSRAMSLDLNSRPKLAAGVRLGDNQGQRVLLMPERALRLLGPSLEIVTLCDGKHSIAQI